MVNDRHGQVGDQTAVPVSTKRITPGYRWRAPKIIYAEVSRGDKRFEGNKPASAISRIAVSPEAPFLLFDKVTRQGIGTPAS